MTNNLTNTQRRRPFFNNNNNNNNATMMILASILLLLVVAVTRVSGQESASSSYDSLVASQCKARCLSLYPWRHSANIQLLLHGANNNNDRRHRSPRSSGVPVVYFPSKMVRSNRTLFIFKARIVLLEGGKSVSLGVLIRNEKTVCFSEAKNFFSFVILILKVNKTKNLSYLTYIAILVNSLNKYSFYYYNYTNIIV